jgi:hypothetical protein
MSWDFTDQHLADLAARFPRQWLVVGGWECQDLSPAGKCRGLDGARSSTLAPLVHIIAGLQRAQRRCPPAFVVENTAMQHNFRDERIRNAEYKVICEALGEPVCIDATQFDSFAHRVRNYWTNLCTQQQLEAAVAQVQRTPGLKVQDVIDPSTGREPALVQKSELPRAGRYPANRVGEPMSAWPTLVAYPGSRASGQDSPVWSWILLPALSRSPVPVNAS